MLLFDLDGTLIDSNGIWTDIDIRFLSRRGLEVTQEYLYAVSPSIVPLAAVFTRDYYHLDMTPEAIVDEWMEGALDAYRNVALKPGTLAFLEQCRDRGEDMALVTACDPGLCRAALERHGLSPFFRAVVYAQELGLEKRNPELFLRAAEVLGVSPAQCVLYEDAPANCAAARAAGMGTVGVYDAFYHDLQTELRQSCDRYIESFQELLEA